MADQNSSNHDEVIDMASSVGRSTGHENAKEKRTTEQTTTQTTETTNANAPTGQSRDPNQSGTTNS